MVVPEDERVSRNRGEPPKTGPAGAARWADYLDWLREDIIDGTLALSPAARRQSRLPSGWSPIELLSHVLHMEQRWFVWGFLGEAVEAPWGDWSADPTSGQPAVWAVPEDTSAEEIADRLREVGRRTRAILSEHGLDELGQAGGRFGDDPPTLEWICFHVLAEYARHAGQFDVALEIGFPP